MLYRLKMTGSNVVTRCDTCGGRLDLRDPYLTVVRQIETQDRDSITIISTYGLAVMHPGCAELNPSGRDGDVCDTCGYRIPRGERYVAAAGLLLEADERAGEIAVLDYTTLAVMHPRCERMHRSGRW